MKKTCEIFSHWKIIIYVLICWCFIRWGMWVRESIQPRVWGEHCSFEHGTVQQRIELWRMFWDKVRPGSTVVQPWETFHHHHRHQLLPSQPRPPQRQWRLVQPSSPPLWPRHAHVPQDRPVSRRNCPCQLPPVRFLLCWIICLLCHCSDFFSRFIKKYSTARKWWSS